MDKPQTKRPAAPPNDVELALAYVLVRWAQRREAERQAAERHAKRKAKKPQGD